MRDFTSSAGGCWDRYNWENGARDFVESEKLGGRSIVRDESADKLCEIDGAASSETNDDIGIEFSSAIGRGFRSCDGGFGFALCERIQFEELP